MHTLVSLGTRTSVMTGSLISSDVGGNSTCRSAAPSQSPLVVMARSLNKWPAEYEFRRATFKPSSSLRIAAILSAVSKIANWGNK